MSVPCSATTGLALDRCDFTKALGTLHFAADEGEKTFKVLISDDSYVEGTEVASLRLSNPGGGAALG
ncbi:MAG: aggregation factor core protein MAFp3, isoform C, partial [Acidobacteria bacterium]